MINGEFIPITEHYGIRSIDIFGDRCFAVYRTSDKKFKTIIAAFKNEEAAVKECKYLEKLNEPKWNKK